MITAFSSLDPVVQAAFIAAGVAITASICTVFTPIILFMLSNRRSDLIAKRLAANNEINRYESALIRGKLDTIHVLVNSTLTVALEAQLAALESMVKNMREVTQLSKKMGVPPAPTLNAEIEIADENIASLKVTLADRRRAAAIEDAMSRRTVKPKPPAAIEEGWC